MSHGPHRLVVAVIALLAFACHSHPEGDRARRPGHHGPAAESSALSDHVHDHSHDGHHHEPARAGAIDDGSGALALSYQPGADAADALIAQALGAVRTEPAAPAFVELALAFIEQRRRTGLEEYLDYAESALSAARARAPDDRAVRRTTALLRLDQHRFEAAREQAQGLVDERPSDATALLILGDSQLELGDYEAATESYQLAIEHQPDLRSYVRGAHMRWLYGDVEGAIDLTRIAMRAGSPSNPLPFAWCLTDLGHIHWHRGEGQLALEAAERALELVIDYPPALRLRARSLVQLGDLEGGLMAYEALLVVDPHLDPLLEAAEVAERLGAAERVGGYLARARQLSEHDPIALASYDARHDRQPERALARIERHLREPAPIADWDAYALALWRLGRIDESRAASDRSLRLGTPDASLYLHRALIELAGGEWAAAEARFEEALALNPRVDPRLVEEYRRARSLATGEAALPSVLDPRDQYAFLQALQTRQAIRDREERAVALEELGAAWQNRRYAWEVRVVPELCRSAEACFVMPFDHARFTQRVLQGWLPRLELASDEEHGSMMAACASYERCVVRVEGALSDVQLSIELPTALTFTDVRFLGARAQMASESWLRRGRPERQMAVVD